MFSDDDLIPLSALQHYRFCPRQCGLIHLEGLWAENRLTAKGRTFHDKAHSRSDEVRDGVRICRSLALRSAKLGLVGVADVVEFHPLADDAPAGAVLPNLPGRWRPFPIEYKRGRPKGKLCDEVQLCGQALCLEEMLDCPISAGALFYGQTRRRKDVVFDESLRETTQQSISAVRAMLANGQTPPPSFTKACKQCSMIDLCMPDRVGRPRAARLYMDRCIRDALVAKAASSEDSVGDTSP